VPLRRQRLDDGSHPDEAALLREQREVLDSLRAQLTERVQAVEARERELREAIVQARAGKLPPNPGPRPQHEVDAVARARLEEVERRERAVAQRERALREAERETAPRERDEDTAGIPAADAERARRLDAREQELARREAELAEREALPAAEPGHEQLRVIERRRAELKEAEQLFLRTREELAARSEAVAARERLVGQRERELDEREDAAGWDRPDVAELEARLRRLEQQGRRIPDVEQTQGFSGGFRKLKEEGTRRTGGP